MNAHPTTPHRLALGRYRLGPELGRGATAVVYRALDTATGADVAVKVVPVELGLEPRVRAEVRAAGRLDHPNVVELLDWGEDRHSLYLVWELVEGASLVHHLAAPGGVGAGAMLRVTVDVLAALEHAHERGVVHRDVKPANILIDPEGRARLSDFGVARLSDETSLTMTGGVVGTYAYMAPEQARGEPVGAPADVWAAALVLYEGLTGRNPNVGTSPADTARRAAEGRVPPLGRARPDLPPALGRHVDGALARDPDARPSARGLAERLVAARGGLGARGRGLRALPGLASATGGGALVALALDRGTDLAVAPRVAAVAGAAALFAWRPREAAVLAGLGAAALLAVAAPAAAVLLGVVGLALLALAGRARRTLILPAAAPALLALGLGPLFAAVAGLVDGWRRRLWVGVSGVAAAVVWQTTTGAPALLFASAPLEPSVERVRDVRSPLEAGRELWEPIAARPDALIGGAALVLAALCVPLVTRAARGRGRLVAAGLWSAGLAALLLASPGAGEDALGAVLPAVGLVLVWAWAPWRRLGPLGAGGASARLRGRPGGGRNRIP